MRRLILMRHAKSDWNHPGLRDHDRPLNPRGQRSATALGEWLRAQEGALPDEVLCSSSTRTRQTLTGLELPPEVPVRFLRELYHAEAETMREALQEADGQRVLMLGHNPGICDMAHTLVAEPPAHERFDDYPTGATLVVDFDIESWQKIGWHKGQPKRFVIPRELV